MTWHKVAGVKTLEQAKSASAKVGDHIVYLAKRDGKLYAMDGVCSHAKCILDDIDEKTLKTKCRFHGAEFDITNGTMLVPPSIAPDMDKSKFGLKTFPVRENGMFVEVDVD